MKHKYYLYMRKDFVNFKQVIDCEEVRTRTRGVIVLPLPILTTCILLLMQINLYFQEDCSFQYTELQNIAHQSQTEKSEN